MFFAVFFDNSVYEKATQVVEEVYTFGKSRVSAGFFRRKKTRRFNKRII